MGVITINSLRLQAHHGVLDQERRVGNTFEISLRINVPSADLAAAADDLGLTVNYAEIVSIIKDEMRIPSRLIENVAFRIARAIRCRFGAMIESGEITVAKLAPPIPAQMEKVSYTCKI